MLLKYFVPPTDVISNLFPYMYLFRYVFAINALILWLLIYMATSATFCAFSFSMSVYTMFV